LETLLLWCSSLQLNSILPFLSTNLVILITFFGLTPNILPHLSIVMTQSKYILDLLHKTRVIEAHSISSLMIFNFKLFKFVDNVFSDRTLYHSVVGAIQYTTLTWPEINFAAEDVGQFMAKPPKSHWIMLN